MNSVRKLLGLLFAVAFALSSGAAFAADKQYKLYFVDPVTFAPITAPTSSPATLAFKFENLGNSSFNALSLTIPNGYSVALSDITSTRGQVIIVGNQIRVNAINLPTGTGQFVVVTLKNVTAGTCGAAGVGGTWLAQPWTGSSVGNGQTFTIVPANSYPPTTLSPNCLTITVPATTFVGVTFQGTVGYTGPGPAPSSIAVASNCGAVITQPVSPYPASFSAKISSTGACTFTASASNFASASASTTVYTANQACGVLNEFSSSVPALLVNTNPPLAYIGPPAWGLQSSVKDKNSSSCTGAGVPFTFNFDPNAVPQTASYNIAPNTTGKSIKAQYVLLWKPVPVDTATANPDNTENKEAGWKTVPNPRPNLGWIKDKTDSSKYKLVPALWCKDDGLGDPADVLPDIPNVYPFNTFTINDYPGYMPTTVANGNKALMCVAQTGSTAVGEGFVQFWHKVTDYIDGAVSWGAD